MSLPVITDAGRVRRAGRGPEVALLDEPGALPVTVVLADPGTAASMGAHVLAPALDALYAPKVPRWWFLRQADSWHVHLGGADRTRAGHALDELVRSGILRHWAHDRSCPPPTAPRPADAADAAGAAAVVEATGAAATVPPCGDVDDRLLLDLHHADSEGVVGYLRERRPVLAERHVAGVLARAVCRAAGLDDLEGADVLDRLVRRGPALDERSQLRARGLADLLGVLLCLPADQVLGPDGYAVRWVTGLTTAAGRLGSAHRAGARPNGRGHLHDLLGHAMTAQWNRLGLSPANQTVLAVATRDALRTRGQR